MGLEPTPASVSLCLASVAQASGGGWAWSFRMAIDGTTAFGKPSRAGGIARRRQGSHGHVYDADICPSNSLSSRSSGGISMGGDPMPLTLRLGTPDDADRCGTICYEAFRIIAEHHQFPADFPSPAVADANFARWLSHPGYAVIVAEQDGRLV